MTPIELAKASLLDAEMLEWSSDLDLRNAKRAVYTAEQAAGIARTRLVDARKNLHRAFEEAYLAGVSP